MRTLPCTEADFLSTVQKHRLFIHRDNGLYRHLLLTQGSFDAHYEIVTFPGHLVITGDYGSFLFSRVEDMFKFFRGDTKGELKINPGYWAEKVLAESVFGEGIRKFDADIFHQNVMDYAFCEEDREIIGPLKSLDFDWLWNIDRYARDAFDLIVDVNNLTARQRELLPYVNKLTELRTVLRSDNEIECISAIWDLDKKVVDLGDFWEAKHTQATFHYIWCLYAIVYAIRLYDLGVEARSLPKEGIDGEK